MPDVSLKATVPLPPEQAFDTFVGQMDVWWPRQGVFPYSFAPKGTRPLHIRLEALAGGRYYETFADGSEYNIGQVTAWEPPAHLAYTWRDPSWQGDTTIEVRFAASDGGAAIAFSQSGFAAAGVAWLIPYYQVGCSQTLAGYFAHCRALRALQELGLSQD